MSLIHLRTCEKYDSACGLVGVLDNPAYDLRPWPEYDVSPPGQRCKRCEKGWRIARPAAQIKESP